MFAIRLGVEQGRRKQLWQRLGWIFEKGRSHVHSLVRGGRGVEPLGYDRGFLIHGGTEFLDAAVELLIATGQSLGRFVGRQVRTSLVGKGPDNSANLITWRTVSKREAECEDFGCHDAFDNQVRFGMRTKTLH